MRDERCLRKVFHTAGSPLTTTSRCNYPPPTTTTGKQGIIYPATDQHFYSRKMSAKSLHTEKHVDCNKTDYATKQQGHVTSFLKHSVVKYKNQCAGFIAQNQRMYKITI